MKARTPLALALLIGLVVGAVGTRALCASGYCGDQSTTGQETTTPTASGFGAGADLREATSAAPQAAGFAATLPATVPSSRGTATASAQITGLAIIADSTADEYRADNPRGGDFGDVTFNWAELLASQRELNLGAWGDRPEPRRAGYEYNWARSGASSKTMIDSGQHTGPAEQILAGQVSHVIIQIGLNDFYHDEVSFAIYEDRLSGQALQQFLDGIIANVEEAVRTVKIAGNQHVILAAMQDYVTPGLLPETTTLLPDTAGRQRLIAAFAYVNQGLSAVALREDVPFFDFNAAFQCELERRHDPDDPRFILVGGERIDLSEKSNDPHHAFLGDEYAHPGTVLSGLFANLFIEQINQVFGTGFIPFSDDELLQIAGLK